MTSDPLELDGRRRAAMIGENEQQVSRFENPLEPLYKPGPNRRSMNRIEQKLRLLHWTIGQLGCLDFDLLSAWKIQNAYSDHARHVHVVVSCAHEQGHVWRLAAAHIRRRLQEQLDRGPATLVTAGGPAVTSMVHGFFPTSMPEGRYPLYVRASHHGGHGRHDRTSAIALVEELGRRFDGTVLPMDGQEVSRENSLFVASLGGQRHSLVAELLSDAGETPDEFAGDVWLHPVDEQGRELTQPGVRRALAKLRPIPELGALPELARSGQVVVLATSQAKLGAVRACLQAGLASALFLTQDVAQRLLLASAAPVRSS